MKKNLMSKNLRKLKSLATMTMLVVVSLLFSQEVHAQIPSLVDGVTASQRLADEVQSLQTLIDNQDFSRMNEKEVDLTYRYYLLLQEDVQTMRPEDAVFFTYERTIQPDLTIDGDRGMPTAAQTKTLLLSGVSSTSGGSNASINLYIDKAIATLKR